MRRRGLSARAARGARLQRGGARAEDLQRRGHAVEAAVRRGDAAPARRRRATIMPASRGGGFDRGRRAARRLDLSAQRQSARTPTNTPTRSNGWSGFSTTHASGWRWRSRWCWPATTTSFPTAADVHNPAAWTGDALFLPQTREKFRALTNLGLTDAIRAVSDDPGLYTFWDYQAGAWQKNNGHPHRPPAAVAAGRRPADHRRHRQARARLGEAVRSRAGLGRSGDRGGLRPGSHAREGGQPVRPALLMRTPAKTRFHGYWIIGFRG